MSKWQRHQIQSIGKLPICWMLREFHLHVGALDFGNGFSGLIDTIWIGLEMRYRLYRANHFPLKHLTQGLCRCQPCLSIHTDQCVDLSPSMKPWLKNPHCFKYSIHIWYSHWPYQIMSIPDWYHKARGPICFVPCSMAIFCLCPVKRVLSSPSGISKCQHWDKMAPLLTIKMMCSNGNCTCTKIHRGLVTHIGVSESSNHLSRGAFH